MASQRNNLMFALTDISIDRDCQHCDPISVAEGVKFYATDSQKRRFLKEGKAELVDLEIEAIETKSIQPESTPAVTPEETQAAVVEEKATVTPDKTQEEKPKAKRRRVKSDTEEVKDEV